MPALPTSAVPHDVLDLPLQLICAKDGLWGGSSRAPSHVPSQQACVEDWLDAGVAFAGWEGQPVGGSAYPLLHGKETYEPRLQLCGVLQGKVPRGKQHLPPNSKLLVVVLAVIVGFLPGLGSAESRLGLLDWLHCGLGHVLCLRVGHAGLGYQVQRGLELGSKYELGWDLVGGGMFSVVNGKLHVGQNGAPITVR